MSHDSGPYPDRFDQHRRPHSVQARVATLRNLADSAGAAFGWDEDAEARLDRTVRLHAARGALVWTLCCIGLVILAYSVTGWPVAAKTPGTHAQARHIIVAERR